MIWGWGGKCGVKMGDWGEQMEGVESYRRESVKGLPSNFILSKKTLYYIIMNDKKVKQRRSWQRKSATWIAIGAVVLILLLLFWVDVVDVLGGGDGSAGF